MDSRTVENVMAMLVRYSRRAEYNFLKETSCAAIVEWRWATGVMMPRLPAWEPVLVWRQPKWTNKQPPHGSLCGLDPTGKILAIRSDRLSSSEEEVHEHFLIHESSGYWWLD